MASEVRPWWAVGWCLDGCDSRDVFPGVQLLVVLTPSLHLLATVLDDVPGEGFQESDLTNM